MYSIVPKHFSSLKFNHAVLVGQTSPLRFIESAGRIRLRLRHDPCNIQATTSLDSCQLHFIQSLTHSTPLKRSTLVHANQIRVTLQESSLDCCELAV